MMRERERERDEVQLVPRVKILFHRIATVARSFCSTENIYIFDKCYPKTLILATIWRRSARHSLDLRTHFNCAYGVGTIANAAHEHYRSNVKGGRKEIGYNTAELRLWYARFVLSLVKTIHAWMKVYFFFACTFAQNHCLKLYFNS